MIKVTNKISATLSLTSTCADGTKKKHYIPPRVRGLVIDGVDLDQVIDSDVQLQISGVRNKPEPPLQKKRKSRRSGGAKALEG